MVILKQPLSRAVILGFKGTIDFYSWKGIAVARRWPRQPRQPRSAAVQAQWAQFKFVTQGFRDIEASAMGGLIGMTTGTQLVPKDEQLQLFYGFAIEERNGPFPPIPSDVSINELMLEIDLAAPGTQAPVTERVHSTTYIQQENLVGFADFSFTPYTHFRIYVNTNATAIGQTVTLQLTPYNLPNTPLSALGDDLLIANGGGLFDSGWVPFATPQTIGQYLTTALKGSNTTVDLSHFGIRLVLKYDP
jgi:hypothetical protein